MTRVPGIALACFALVAAPSIAAQNRTVKTSWELACASAPIVGSGALTLGVDLVEWDSGARGVFVIVVDPLKGGIDDGPIFWRVLRDSSGGFKPPSQNMPARAELLVGFESQATVCTEPVLTASGSRLLLDWVEDPGAGIIALAIRIEDRFSDPVYQACNTGEPLPDCRSRLRTEFLTTTFAVP